MKLKYEKNFTDEGYIMNYRKGPDTAPYKNQVLQFTIEISDIKPLIWRRIHVPSNYNFWDLHVAIQDAMGWLDYHLHHFEIKGKGKKKEVHIGIPDFYRMGDMQEVYPGWEIPVIEYFNDLGVTARYNYDYGDDWWHTVQLEGYLFKKKKTHYPLCLSGERACPPEDCGGVHGYYEIVETLFRPDYKPDKDDKNANEITEDEYFEDYEFLEEDEYEEEKEREELITWVGEDWDPEIFDKNAVKFDDPYKRWMIAFFEK